ncbi:pirin family protein [Streptomyces oceani]|uniref:Pirin n=1 Tax=Streptomyces oceani TaxID=1075402 RepID=A0A1E7JVX3_9ACTN|nr:pirin family protein [Streptomyces oceani]OEU94824.1 pirin [Streptomyces oceani]
MPAVTADTLTLPRVTRPPERGTAWRQVATSVTARRQMEGEGFEVRRPFPGTDLSLADPFLLLDHLGAVEYGPGEAKGAPWHPHRGFETVTYMMDGAFEHRDSTGGGGLITEGATQWMTAGAGVLHSELPPQDFVARGGLFHGVQLWVNLPKELKWTPARYQDIRAGETVLLSSDDGGALLRLIAGELDGHRGPGMTRTPITYVHATVAPGARLALPWPERFNALVYALAGRGTVGTSRLAEGQLAVLGPGEALSLQAARDQDYNGSRGGFEVLLLGGSPLHEPVARYGPFVMNTKPEIIQAMEDFQAGRLGVNAPEEVPHHTSADEKLRGS